MTVERLWLDRWLGKGPLKIKGPEEMRGLGGVRSEWQDVEKDMNVYLSQLEKMLTYTNTEGETCILEL